MKKTLIVLAVVVGVLVYCAYIFTILRPYFARVELETAWEIDYRSTPFTQMHLGQGGTIYLTTEDSVFIAVSPAGEELYRYEPVSPVKTFGFDDGTDDMLWVATMEYVDPQQFPQSGQQQHTHAPVPVPTPTPTPEIDAASGQAPFVARLTGLTNSGVKQVDTTFDTGGIIRNLWCLDGRVIFMDSNQNLNCYDEQGNELWVKNFPAMVDFVKGDIDRLYLDCGSKVVAIDLEGNELWSTMVGGGAGLSQWRNWSVANGRLCVLDNYDTFHVIDSSGQLVLSEEIPYSANLFGGYSYGNPSVKIHSDSTVYAVSGDNILSKFSPDGNKLWNFKVGSNFTRLELDANGTVYLLSHDRGLMAISAAGQLMWRDESFGDVSSYTMDDGYLRVSTDGHIYLAKDNKLVSLKIPQK